MRQQDISPISRLSASMVMVPGRQLVISAKGEQFACMLSSTTIDRLRNRAPRADGRARSLSIRVAETRSASHALRGPCPHGKTGEIGLTEVLAPSSSFDPSVSFQPEEAESEFRLVGVLPGRRV